MREDVITPKLKVPFSIVGGGAEVVEQDEIDELAQCVGTLLRTPTGFREDEPEYGLEDQVFTEGGVNPALLDPIIHQWEPRVESLTGSEMEGLINRVDINIRKA